MLYSLFVMTYTLDCCFFQLSLCQTLQRIKMHVLLDWHELSTAGLHCLLRCNPTNHCLHRAEITSSNIRQLQNQVIIQLCFGSRLLIY